MLMNYYSFVKDNDIYDEFININGINKKKKILILIRKWKCRCEN